MVYQNRSRVRNLGIVLVLMKYSSTWMHLTITIPQEMQSKEYKQMQFSFKVVSNQGNYRIKLTDHISKKAMKIVLDSGLLIQSM